MYNNMHCVKNLLPQRLISYVSLTSQSDVTKNAHPVTMSTILYCWHETKSYGGDQCTTRPPEGKRAGKTRREFE